ncbi:MAG: 30S ribosomal protein S17e [Candidatus Asgardarchaeia archaeon]
MGKIRTDTIKRTARALVNRYPNLFKPDFEYNKQIIEKIVLIRSKKLKNQLAGYVTHIVKGTIQ